jgi:prepilin-type N-terminal cleavage/methylation domain-containing protein
MKLFNKNDMNNKGFSLTEVMVAAALMGIVSIVSFGLLKNVKNADTQSEHKSDQSLFISQFGQWVLSAEGCKEFIGEVPTNVYQDMVFEDYKGYGSHKMFNVGDTFIERDHIINKDHLEVESFQFRFKDDSAIVQKNIMGPGGIMLSKKEQVLQVRMRVRMSKKGSKLSAGSHRIKEKFFEVPVLTDNADRIDSCILDMSQTEICSTLNLVYIPAKETCEAQPGATSCNVKGSYATITCTPGGYGCLNTFGDGNNLLLTPPAPTCGVGEVSYRTGFRRTSYTVGCGKKCTVTIYRNETFFTCMICP